MPIISPPMDSPRGRQIRATIVLGELLEHALPEVIWVVYPSDYAVKLAGELKDHDADQLAQWAKHFGVEVEVTRYDMERNKYAVRALVDGVEFEVQYVAEAPQTDPAQLRMDDLALQRADDWTAVFAGREPVEGRDYQLMPPQAPLRNAAAVTE